MIAFQVAHPPPDTTSAIVRTVAVTDTTVTPRELVVSPATLVLWHNEGRNRHTITEDGGLFESGVLIPDEEFRLSAPATPGTYAYHCRFHGYIRGTLTVSLVSLEIEASVVIGGRPMIGGAIPNAPVGTVVSIERRLPGSWEEVGRATTDGAGAFRLRGPALRMRTAFRAITPEAVSPSARAEVRHAVTATRRGARMTVRVRPQPRGGSVHLERLDLDTYRWVGVAARRASAGPVRFALSTPGVYRASVGARDGLAGAESRTVEFRPSAFRE